MTRVLSTPRESGVRRVARVRAQGLGMLVRVLWPLVKGDPDLLLCYRGRVAVLETKRPVGGRLARIQRVRLSEFRDHALLAGVASSVADARDFVDVFATCVELGCNQAGARDYLRRVAPRCEPDLCVRAEDVR